MPHPLSLNEAMQFGEGTLFDHRIKNFALLKYCTTTGYPQGLTMPVPEALIYKAGIDREFDGEALKYNEIQKAFEAMLFPMDVSNISQLNAESILNLKNQTETYFALKRLRLLIEEAETLALAPENAAKIVRIGREAPKLINVIEEKVKSALRCEQTRRYPSSILAEVAKEGIGFFSGLPSPIFKLFILLGKKVVHKLATKRDRDKFGLFDYSLTPFLNFQDQIRKELLRVSMNL